MAAKSIFITELNNGIITRQVYFSNYFGWLLAKSYMALRVIQSLSTAFFELLLHKVVASTFVRCGGIFYVDFIANLVTSLSVKEL